MINCFAGTHSALTKLWQNQTGNCTWGKQPISLCNSRAPKGGQARYYFYSVSVCWYLSPDTSLKVFFLRILSFYIILFDYKNKSYLCFSKKKRLKKIDDTNMNFHAGTPVIQYINTTLLLPFYTRDIRLMAWSITKMRKVYWIVVVFVLYKQITWGPRSSVWADHTLHPPRRHHEGKLLKTPCH